MREKERVEVGGRDDGGVVEKWSRREGWWEEGERERDRYGEGDERGESY